MAGLPAALALVCIACALVALGVGTIRQPRATLASAQSPTSEQITPNPEAVHA